MLNVSFWTIDNPFLSANDSAAFPVINLCGEFESTRRAALIGFLTFLTHATAPDDLELPSIMQASNSCLPASLYTAPLPALKRKQSSNAFVTISTASKLVPFEARILAPEFNAICIPNSMRCFTSGLTSSAEEAPT